ncbi:ethanolamine ammonia-lyase reactivating factor EutA, partial [Microbacteriaceae bacterium K1510]|nr:ethanolamine ammonia-lyase reactivating factor EutA [Microbacteriaceae bacterium K1510]
IKQSDIKSGAVIITGETATKRNAQQIVHLLAERSGDFVVATAGADLEGVLAGKGSGAEARSKQIHGIIANIDIGGGTANIAFFHRGKAIGTVTFHVGGRLIRID